MRIGIDARSLDAGPAGVATYVRNLLRHISLLDPIGGDFPPNNFLWNQVRATWAQVSRGWPVYHAPGYTCPLVGPSAIVLSVHDLSHLIHPEWYPYRVTRLRRWYYEASLQRAGRILVPSKFSALEMESHYPYLADRVRRIPLAVSGDFSPDPDLAEKVRQRGGLPAGFLLHVGDIHRRRNIGLLLDISRELKRPLVLVGRLLEPSVPTEGARILTGIPTETLKGLYCAASVLVYPSVYEGFGLPLLEAMACGLPVVAAKRASIPEVCGDAAILVEPDRKSFQSGVEQALEEPGIWRTRGFERVKLFRWRNTAEATVQVYGELIGEDLAGWEK